MSNVLLGLMQQKGPVFVLLVVTNNGLQLNLQVARLVSVIVIHALMASLVTLVPLVSTKILVIHALYATEVHGLRLEIILVLLVVQVLGLLKVLMIHLVAQVNLFSISLN